ncbi:hypothetical protein [Bacillus thuringiensis]|uniref:hypothetical protein n=1 Tax=Bacillus thuringiensis TaxID=1428 RepID=UPI00119EFF82|nr:hypothetical protein [Bacillus thuringiensis]
MNKKIILSFLTLTTIISGYGCSASTQKGEIANTTQEKNKGERVRSLLLTPDTLQKQFNEAALKFNSSYSLPQLQLENGQMFDTFSYDFNNGFNIVGSVNKSNKTIHELSLHLDPNKSNEEFLPRMKTYYTLSKIMITSVTPNISDDELNTILTNLNLFEDEFTPQDKPGYYRTDKLYYERNGALFYINDARPSS